MPENKNEFEKKSERIEIRVSHSKKQAFNTACEDSGDTPSGALRRFIDGYIRRADKDAFSDGLRAMGRMAKRRWLPLTAAAAALLISGYFTGKALRPDVQDGPIVTASTDDFPPINYTLFAAYDKNANGVLDLGEVAENDEHLHRVLNLDGEAGIAPSEFYAKAVMIWQYVKEKNVETGLDDSGMPTTSMIDVRDTVVVDFDLTDENQPVIKTRTPVMGDVLSVSEFKEILSHGSMLTKKELRHLNKAEDIRTGEFVDRTVSWEKGKSMPVLSSSNGGFRTRFENYMSVDLP